MLHPTMRLLLNRQGLQAELLAPDPAHNRSSHKDASFDRQIDDQGTRLPNVYGNIAREFPPAQRKVPHSASSLEEPSVVRDGAVDREALVGTKRERHEEPRRERIVGEGQSNRKAGRGKWWNDRWEGVGALREGTKRNGRSTICREIVPAPFHSPTGFIFGVAIAGFSPGH